VVPGYCCLRQCACPRALQIENPTKGFASLEERYGDLSNVAVVTIAAELEGALDAIKGLKRMWWAKGALGIPSTSVVVLDF
jgi:hypothetical protein